MPNITILGMTGTCSHRVVQTDQGDFPISLSEVRDARPETPAESREGFLVVARHQYLTRRAAGRTQTQALNDLVNFVVRL